MGTASVEERSVVTENVIYIKGLPVNVKTWGTWIEDPLNDVKEMVIFIPGTIGLVGFYTRLLSTLYHELNGKIPVWVIGQTGFDETDLGKPLDVPAFSGNESLFNLEAQVQYKLEFIRKYIPNGIKITLVGHSLGCCQIMQLLKYADVKAKVKKCYLLFPAIERLKEAPMSKLVTHLIVPIYPIVQFLLTILNFLPYLLRAFLVYIFHLVTMSDKNLVKTMVKAARVNNFELSVYLTMQQVKNLREIDVDLIKKNINLLKFYYGASDGWVPRRYYYELKQKIPEVDAVLDSQNISHILVLYYSVKMAKITAQWIKDEMKLN